MTIRAVARRVGVSAPAIYRHFPDKNALLEAACLDTFAELDEIIATAIGGISDPVEALRVLGHTYVRFAIEQPEHHRLLFMGRANGERPAPSEGELCRLDAFGHLLDTLARLEAEGYLRPCEDPRLLGYALWMTVLGAAALFVAKPHLRSGEREALVDRVLSMALLGFVPEEHRARAAESTCLGFSGGDATD